MASCCALLVCLVVVVHCCCYVLLCVDSPALAGVITHRAVDASGTADEADAADDAAIGEAPACRPPASAGGVTGGMPGLVPSGASGGVIGIAASDTADDARVSCTWRCVNCCCLLRCCLRDTRPWAVAQAPCSRH